MTTLAKLRVEPRGAHLGLGGVWDPMQDTAISTFAERRVRRSSDPVTALHYQLSATRHGADLEAVVLVDDLGSLVASAGTWAACEELAAYAPLFGNPQFLARLGQAGQTGQSSRIAELSSRVDVRPVPVDGGAAIICGQGGGKDRTSFIERAAEGCRRILSVAV